MPANTGWDRSRSICSLRTRIEQIAGAIEGTVAKLQLFIGEPLFFLFVAGRRARAT